MEQSPFQGKACNIISSFSGRNQTGAVFPIMRCVDFPLSHSFKDPGTLPKKAGNPIYYLFGCRIDIPPFITKRFHFSRTRPTSISQCQRHNLPHHLPILHPLCPFSIASAHLLSRETFKSFLCAFLSSSWKHSCS